MLKGAAAALILLVAAAAFGFDKRLGEMRDFEVYWTAAARAEAGAPLYRFEDGHYQFKYLPAFAVLTIPIAWLSLTTAKSVWFVISVALLLLLVALSVTALAERRKPAWFITAAIVVTMGKFYGHELVLGQANVLFAVLAVLGLVHLSASSTPAPTTPAPSTLAIALFVAAMAIKPYAVIFLPWIVFMWGRHAAVVAVLGLVAVLLVPLPLYGGGGSLELYRAWWATVTQSTEPNLTNPDNVSLAAFFAKWLGIGTAARLAAAAAAFVLLSTTALAIAGGGGIAGRATLEGAVLLMVIPLVSPQGWDYLFLIATPAVALFVNYEDRLPPAVRATAWVALATTGLSLFDLLGRARYAAFMSWSVITVCFVVLFAALITIRTRRIA